MVIFVQINGGHKEKRGGEGRKLAISGSPKVDVNNTHVAFTQAG